MRTQVTITPTSYLWNGAEFAKTDFGRSMLAASIAEAGFDGFDLRRPLLTPEQEKASLLAYHNGLALRRFPGGYWCPRNGWNARTQQPATPGAWVGTQTIKAMVKKGVFQVVDGGTRFDEVRLADHTMD